MTTRGPAPETPDSAPARVEFIGAKLLGIYEVRERLAEGGMGSVYLAEDCSLARRVAVKVPHRRFLDDERFLARFSLEIGELVRLEHPHIVRILAQGRHEGVPFYVLQYLAGGSLEDRIDRAQSGLPTKDVLAWARAIADTLDFIHAQGTIHRDVKPDNILFDEQGHVYLSDFGVAKVLAGESVALTDEHACVGSPQHMAPEQGLGSELTPSVDQYALASMVYTATCGRPPYDAETPIQILVNKNQRDAPLLHEVAPELPRAASAAVQRAMSRDPDDRFPTCSAFVNALEGAFEAPVVVPTARPARRKRPVSLVLLVALLGLALWLLVQGAANDPPQQDPLSALMGRYHAEPPDSEAAFRPYIEELDATPGDAAARALLVVYGDFVAGPGHDDPEARRALGHREFDYQIPSAESANRSLAYAHFRGVELARKRRWFAAEDEALWQLALDAQRESEAHWAGLRDDPHVRATDAVRMQIERSEAFAGFHLAWHWQAPYLLCLLSREPLSRYDLLAIDDRPSLERRSRALRQRQVDVQATLEAEARLLHPLYTTFLRIFGDQLDLRDLMAPFGGRPDLAPGRRAFEDGAPLPVLVFEDPTELRRALQIPPSMRGDCEFNPTDGWLYVASGAAPWGEAPDGAASRTNEVLREGVRQLQFWFGRQRGDWAPGRSSLDWFTFGVADWLAGLRVDEFRKTAVPGINETRRASLRMLAEATQKAGREFTLLPLESLTAMRNVLAASLVPKPGLSQPAAALLAIDQSWALVHFLWSFESGRHREGLLNYAAAYGVAAHPAGDSRAAFEAALGITGVDGWARLNEAFRSYVIDELLPVR